jgi:hypothetical protein
MAYTLFISESRLKRLTAVHENLEPQELTPFVIQAQDVYVQELLGTKFYNNLKNRVISGTTSTQEVNLLNDYIAPMLANYSVYLALPSFNYKMKNKSVLNPSAEEAQNTDLSELKYLRGSIKDTADFYRERAREFLIDNDTDFPDYVNPGVDGMMPDRRNAYSSGIVIPRVDYGCTWADLNRSDPNAPYNQ